MEQNIGYFGSPQFIISVVIGLAAIALFLLMRILSDRYGKKKKAKGEKVTVLRVGFHALEIAVLLLGFVTVLQVNGINISALAAGLGIAGLVVGIALQDYIKDIVMGIHILIDHFFSVGECVEYMGREGVVVGLNLMTTKIGDLDDHAITTVCNRNFSEIRRLADRFDVDVPLSYEEDLAAVREVMEEICKRVAKNQKVRECHFEGTQSFEASFVNYRIRIYCDAHDRADVRREALGTVQDVLAEKGIRIPYSQLDVHCDMAKQ